jgi:uncharacterized membrane protein YfcA
MRKMTGGFDFLLVGLAAVAGGAVNALAGGGTLITFPLLTAIGIPAVAANVTNTVALCPGYLGATIAQMKDLRGQGHRLLLLIPASVLGGIMGGVLLLKTGEHLFRALVPFLILFATGLIAFQDPLRKRIMRRVGQTTEPATAHGAWIVLPVVPAAMYGGYFGAGVSVMVLAVLGLVLDDTLARLNALKQAVAFSINIAAAIFFLFSGQVVWAAAAVMAVGAMIGGALGGRLAGKISSRLLRRIVVTIGVVVSLIYFLR